MDNNILDQDDLLFLFEKHFKDEFSKIGKSNLEIMIEDFVDGGVGNSNFESPSGGHNYDLVASMSLVVGILQLLIASADYIAQKIRKEEKPKSEAVINYIIINFPNQPTNRIVEKAEVLDSITRVIESKKNENAQ